jgi:hypothetical protein
MKYRITTQRQLRREFWKTFPALPRRKIKVYYDNAKIWNTKTLLTFYDWVQALRKKNKISDALAQRVTL